MRQALHIFGKDVRRLQTQIALLGVAIGVFAWLDIRFEPMTNGSSLSTTVIELVAGALVWLLIARAVHEESLTGDNQFWFTRPYSHTSLLVAKILMAVTAVIVPFFLADCLIVGLQSFSVTENFGGLLLRQAITACWLVLPPFAIATVTRSIAQDIFAWIGFGFIAGMTYVTPRIKGWFVVTNETYWLAAGVLLILAVLWRQYWRRGVAGSRAMLAAAVLVPALAFPDAAAVELEQLRNDPAASRISLSAGPAVFRSQEGAQCANVSFSVTGARPEWRVGVLAEKDTFTTEDGHSTGGAAPWGPSANWGNFLPCISPKGLKDLGAARKVSIHVSVVLAVMAPNPVWSGNMTGGSLRIPEVGRCELRDYPTGDYGLACASPLRAPSNGMIEISGNQVGQRLGAADSTPNIGISQIAFPVTPLGMLPGMSPVYKWTSQAIDPRMRYALATGRTVEFRSESRIAVLEREVDIPDVQFSE